MEKTNTETLQEFEAFLKARAAVKNTFNQELKVLTEKMNDAASKNKEVVLLSLPMTNTLISLRKQTLDNLFSFEKEFYPEHGLFLNEIQIIYREYIGNIGSQFCSNIEIKFCFNDKRFNNAWSSFSLGKLSFNDEKLRFADNSMGVCLDPDFLDDKKYHFAKKAILDMKTKLSSFI